MSASASDIDVLISEIRVLLQQVGSADLSSTAHILRMARLDLLTLVNDINENELKAFSESLNKSLDEWARPLDVARQPVERSSHEPPPLSQ